MKPQKILVKDSWHITRQRPSFDKLNKFQSNFKDYWPHYIPEWIKLSHWDIFATWFRRSSLHTYILIHRHKFRKRSTICIPRYIECWISRRSTVLTKINPVNFVRITDTKTRSNKKPEVIFVIRCTFFSVENVVYFLVSLDFHHCYRYFPFSFIIFPLSWNLQESTCTFLIRPCFI